ncbi:hypothetical protein GGX14DRAFT_565666 [Mycena pura]|uniref:Uncharacterized protein n=1 Tax=Mycena pura TaxID=153505 RepID=A0AAD6VE89_9AGAR|nr:hypothetical protein GGX14DRAFT_565666 [Mycena pura]
MLFRINPEFHNCLPLPADLKDMKPIYTFIEDATGETLAKGRATFILMRADGDQHYGAPSTEPIAGESLRSGALLRWYANWLQRLAATDDHAGLVIYELTCRFAGPIDGFHPALILKILRRALAG